MPHSQRAAKGQYYYALLTASNRLVSIQKIKETNHPLDDKLFSEDNYFLTMKDAESELYRLRHTPVSNENDKKPKTKNKTKKANK